MILFKKLFQQTLFSILIHYLDHLLRLLDSFQYMPMMLRAPYDAFKRLTKELLPAYQEL